MSAVTTLYMPHKRTLRCAPWHCYIFTQQLAAFVLCSGSLIQGWAKQSATELEHYQHRFAKPNKCAKLARPVRLGTIHKGSTHCGGTKPHFANEYLKYGEGKGMQEIAKILRTSFINDPLLTRYAFLWFCKFRIVRVPLFHQCRVLWWSCTLFTSAWLKQESLFMSENMPRDHLLRIC